MVAPSPQGIQALEAESLYSISAVVPVICPSSFAVVVGLTPRRP
jgi:hypothetical protein